MQLSERFYKMRKLENLVENQTSYTLNSAALHVFETHQKADRVLLQFDQPVLASMIQGKKIMHLRNVQSFDFLPGESLILPSGEPMCIDFPEAGLSNPTRCLAMAIDEGRIKEVIQLMNETLPKADNLEWGLIDYNFHFTNDLGIYKILQRLLYLFTENHASKDLFVDFTLRELIIRILQANNRTKYEDNLIPLSSSKRLAFVLSYIKDHISKPLTVEELSDKAYMSPSNFYKVFKNELGLSPIEYILNERIKLACSMLQNPLIKIKEVYIECGFENRSYFNRVFKSKKQLSPKEYQEKVKTSLKFDL